MTAIMPMPFDATLKNLAREYPRAILATFDGPPPPKVALLNVDLSTVTTAADFVVGLGDPLQEIVHIDFQASASATKHVDVLVYNALLHRQYLVPVHSITVLLRPQAAHANLSGSVNYAPRSPRGRMDFTYEVIRLWEWPAEALLAGELGASPLAVLGRLPEGLPVEDGLAATAQRLIVRLESETSRDQAKSLLTAAFVLTGMRVRREAALRVFRKVSAMKESDTYLAIMDEGSERQAKKDILRLGQKRLGPLDETITSRLESISDLDRLDRILERLLEAHDWQDLLNTP